ncbi:MAG: hypothetical protein ACI37T_09585 [Candidatus Gastranaerophilaceae bacterium]
MKREKFIAALVLTSILGLPGVCASNFSVTTQTVPQMPIYQTQFATPQYTQVPYQQKAVSATQPLKGHVVVVPAGVNISATTTMEISSATVSLGQPVSMALTNGFYYNNVCIAPAGSTVTGNVILARKGGHAGKNGQLQIRFTQINTPYGNVIPISAMIKTTDGTGILKAGTAKDTTKDYAKDLAVGSGAGAVLGLTMGALSGGSVGKGAAYGTAVGAGAGLVKSLWDKGIDVVIPANSGLELTVDQPITVQASN